MQNPERGTLIPTRNTTHGRESKLPRSAQKGNILSVKSYPSLLTCGVPQDSVPGTVLFLFYTVAQPLSGVISHHSVFDQMFADDTELYKSDSAYEAFTLARTIESCISDVSAWFRINFS